MGHAAVERGRSFTPPFQSSSRRSRFSSATPTGTWRWRGRDSIYKPGTVKILPCELRDLEQSWEYFRRSDLHKLSAVDATSFAIMKRARIRLAFAFDHHFAVAGYRLVA